MTKEVLSDHLRIDARSIALHRAAGEKIRANPSLLQRVSGNLERWIAENSQSMPYFQDWKEILKQPLPALLAHLVEPSERMAALRQSSPFAGLLAPKERWAIYKAFQQSDSRCEK